MNLSNLINLAKFAIKQAPETALAVVKGLKPSNWKLSIDGVIVNNYQPSFNVIESFKKKILIVTIKYNDLAGNPHFISAESRFKNDGTDDLIVDGVRMVLSPQGFDFDAKPFKKDVRVEMRFTTPEGLAREIVLSNTL